MESLTIIALVEANVKGKQLFPKELCLVRSKKMLDSWRLVLEAPGCNPPNLFAELPSLKSTVLLARSTTRSGARGYSD